MSKDQTADRLDRLGFTIVGMLLFVAAPLIGLVLDTVRWMNRLRKLSDYRPNPSRDIQEFMRLLEKSGGVVRSAPLPQNEYDAAMLAVEHGLCTVENRGTSEQSFVIRSA